jgi:hypothetical protein
VILVACTLSSALCEANQAQPLLSVSNLQPGQKVVASFEVANQTRSEGAVTLAVQPQSPEFEDLAKLIAVRIWSQDQPNVVLHAAQSFEGEILHGGVHLGHIPSQASRTYHVELELSHDVPSAYQGREFVFDVLTHFRVGTEDTVQATTSTWDWITVPTEGSVLGTQIATSSTVGMERANQPCGSTISAREWGVWSLGFVILIVVIMASGYVWWTRSSQSNTRRQRLGLLLASLFLILLFFWFFGSSLFDCVLFRHPP